MKFNSFFFLVFILLTSCMTYEDVQFKGANNFKINKIDTKEVTFSVALEIYNPNNYKIKVKPGTIDVLNGRDKLIGKAKIKDKLVIEKNKTGSYPITVNAKLSDLFLSGGGSFMDLVRNKSTDIKLKGDIKVRARWLGKKIPIDQTKTIDVGKYIRGFGR